MPLSRSRSDTDSQVCPGVCRSVNERAKKSSDQPTRNEYAIDEQVVHGHVDRQRRKQRGTQGNIAIAEERSCTNTVQHQQRDRHVRSKIDFSPTCAGVGQY